MCVCVCACVGVHKMFGMKEGSQGIETYIYHCDLWVKTLRFSTSTLTLYTFCMYMASLVATWMPSSNLWYTKSQRSRHVYDTIMQGRPRLVEFV